MMRGLIAAAALAAIGYVIRGWLGAGNSVDRARLRIAAVSRGTLVRDLVVDGRVVAANNPTLYAIAAGTVEFHARAGDKTTRGQVLATVSSPELQSRLVQEQATLAGLTTGVERAMLDVEHSGANAQKLISQAEVDRQTAAREVEINKEMFGLGVVSELEFRRSQDALKKTEIALQHARIEAGLQRKETTFDLGTRKQSLDRQRAVVTELERQVAALKLTSPVDGQVGELLVAQAAKVESNTPIVTVVDLGAFEIELRVPDSFAREVTAGMAAEIRADSTTFAGQVVSVSPEVVDGKVAARLKLVDQRPAGLRQNQRLSARILIEERPNVLMVQRGPFVEAGGGNYAYFVEDETALRRPIRLGAVSLDSVELVSGAKAGDQIIVTGAEMFGNAQSVRLAD